MADLPDDDLPFDELRFSTDLFKMVLNVDPSTVDAVVKLAEYMTTDPLLSSDALAKMDPIQKIGIMNAKMENDSPLDSNEINAVIEGFRPIFELLKSGVEHDIERMGSKLADVGFPDPRKDNGAWRIIAKMVGCDPDGLMEDIFDSAMAYHASKQQADCIDDGDGLLQDDRILVWGGVRFTLTTNQAVVFRLLVNAYPGDVTHGAFEDKGIRILRDSFRFNNARGKKEYYPCWGVIADGSAKDSKRLIDPSIVRSDQKRFQVPNIIPIDPQGSPE